MSEQRRRTSDTYPSEKSFERFANNPAVKALSQISSMLGVALAGIGIWVFMQVWQDIRSLQSGFNDVQNRVSRVEETVKSIQRSQDSVESRTNRLEDKLFKN